MNRPGVSTIASVSIGRPSAVISSVAAASARPTSTRVGCAATRQRWGRDGRYADRGSRVAGGLMAWDISTSLSHGDWG